MTDISFSLIPQIEPDAPLHPAHAPFDVTASDITASLNRIGKKSKKNVLWMHVTILAAIREQLGKSPKDVLAMLARLGYDNEVAARAARFWRTALTLRDQTLPMVKSWTEKEAANALAAVHQQPLTREELALAQLLHADLSLLACGLGSNITDEILQDIEAEPAMADIPMINKAIRAASIATGFGDPGADEDETVEDLITQADNAFFEVVDQIRKESVADAEIAVAELAKVLAPTNLVILDMALTLFTACMNRIIRDEVLFGYCLRQAGFFDSKQTVVLVQHNAYLTAFSEVLAREAQKVDRSRIRLPNPKNMDDPDARAQKVADSVLKAIHTVKAPEMKRFAKAFGIMKILLVVLGQLTAEEIFGYLAKYGAQIEAENYPMCFSLLGYVASEQFEKIAAESLPAQS